MVKQEHTCTSPIDPVVFPLATPSLIFGPDTGGGAGQDAPPALLMVIPLRPGNIDGKGGKRYPLFPPDGGGAGGGGDAPLICLKMIPLRPGNIDGKGGKRYPTFPDENPTGGGGKHYPIFPDDIP